MMKNVLLISALMSASMAIGQVNPVDFEPDGNGADWTWATFEAPQGANNPEFSVVPNISVDDTNPSANVARMVIEYASSEPWGQAGCESQHGSDIGSFVITEANSTVSMMVYQVGFASPVALKFATPVGAAFFETIVPNDVADAWVEVEFDMSGWIGSTLPGDPDQIIFFPSYGPRETGHTVYFDNVVFGGSGPGPVDPMDPAPDPTVDEELVLSVYSDFYANNVVDNFNFNAFQGGGTVSEIQIQGNNTGKIEGLTFYGAEWTAADLNDFDFVHIDYYASTSTAFNFYLIDQTAEIPGGAAEEPRYSFGPAGADEVLQQGQWESVDIPLQHFLDFPTGSFEFDLNDIYQWKFDGNGTLYFDNIYFYKELPFSANTLQSAEMQAFPNPAKDFWNLSVANASIERVQLFNIVGQEVWSSAITAELLQIDASGLMPGIYIARVYTERGVGVVKLVKE